MNQSKVQQVDLIVEMKQVGKLGEKSKGEEAEGKHYVCPFVSTSYGAG